MKITWFGGKTFRIQRDGQIYLVEDQNARHGVNPREIASGVDKRIALATAASDLGPFEPPKSRQRARLIDQPEAPTPSVHSFAGGILFSDGDDPALFIAPDTALGWSRFADESVIVLAQDNCLEIAKAIFDAARPKLLALAVDDIADEDFGRLADMCGETAVQLLEQRMALEA